jgi:UV DNA damage endonuclease
MISLSQCGFACCCKGVEDATKLKAKVARLGKFQERLATNPVQARDDLLAMWKYNTRFVESVLRYCRDKGIGLYRIESEIFPLMNRVECPIGVEDLPKFSTLFKNITLSMHPDHFVNLGSPTEGVRNNSKNNLEMHDKILNYFNGGDTANICIHGGGVYNDRPGTIERFQQTLKELSPAVLKRLRLENDERSWTVQQLLEITKDLPIIFDTHHWEINHDQDDTMEQAAELAFKGWSITPETHYSEQNVDKKIGAHSEYITGTKFDKTTERLLRVRPDITVVVEAKAKDYALLDVFK